MAKKKRRDKTSRKPAPRRRAALRPKATRKKKAAAAKAPRRKRASRKVSAKVAARQPRRVKTKRAPAAGRLRGRADSDFNPASTVRGLGSEAGGQSGDTEGLSRTELADSESVEELLEEGQAFEAGVISGVEKAPDADKGGVRTRQVPEDDVPQEYLDED
ncbi:MAG TPA: hypothetical protein VK780_00225 [Thermoanaerobaculia bacterium]|jgi:hypothetical protein|nr:hypothetical protein [Thermoanaerobaculia bacterium]